MWRQIRSVPTRRRRRRQIGSRCAPAAGRTWADSPTVRRSTVLLDAPSTLGLMPLRPGHEPGVRFAPTAPREVGSGGAVRIEVTIFLHSAEWDRWALPSASVPLDTVPGKSRNDVSGPHRRREAILVSS